MTGFHSPLAAFLRIVTALAAAAAFIAADLAVAQAQSQSCAQITAILRGIERNQAFAGHNGIVEELRARQQQVMQGERQWISDGCQQMYNAGQAMTQQCRSLAQIITVGRTQVQQLQAMAQEGQSLARNHQAMMADYQRNGCDAGQRGSLLDGMFGGQGGYDYMPPYDPWASQQTRRTVCVRTCDGFYWPISFSTTDSYIAQDAIQCHEMCPGTEVALFSYRNPGEEPEDMISLSGAPYRSMPYAFRFRQEVDMSCSCNTREPAGTLTLAEAGGGSQAVVALGDLSFPLPQPDPRGPELTVAEAIHIPLPRPRPRADGTGAAVAAQPDREGTELRIVEFGDREVRIVGPETPYVPEGAEAP
ncbi:DUF2865 domain-containing protein [Pelagibacterium lacus]|uniref:DUF2865 domain-containing protein n=1 Tax=Pelagibacterium lacus TaxID=2282655 RepID=A0A369W6R9_9HYPH|nr:DUF2865 domain-containing protein [Pelagibacterium lacus]RDE10384.1 DUF2865 domain-containing protein [Pelagibacterium lacus]